MKLEKIVTWLDQTLNVAAFDDVSNNGIQIERSEVGGQRSEVKLVAFAVDASVKAVKAAAKAGAQLLVVHHGISWGGGIRRIEGGIYNVVKAAMDVNLALYGVHLPLDASKKYGNNWEIARFLKLTNVRPAFNYHGNVIGVIGTSTRNATVTLGTQTIKQSKNQTIGICSGGAGDFGAEAKLLGCDLYVTGEASWGDVIAAENCGIEMICAGHYETEVFGIRAVAKAMAKALKVKTVDLSQNGPI